MMARCVTSEKQGRAVFYGAMIAEGFQLSGAIAYPIGIAAAVGSLVWFLTVANKKVNTSKPNQKIGA